MKTRYALGVMLVLVMSLGIVSAVQAHGAAISYDLETTTRVEIQATFASGESMAGAQVVVYAPNDLTSPWMTGTCDENGLFSFTPDGEIAGTWEVQVRQAGHGDTMYVEIGAEPDTETDEQGDEHVATGSQQYTPLQLTIMSASVLWGLLGTFLFFMKRGWYAHS